MDTNNFNHWKGIVDCVTGLFAIFLILYLVSHSAEQKAVASNQTLSANLVEQRKKSQTLLGRLQQVIGAHDQVKGEHKGRPSGPQAVLQVTIAAQL